MKSISFALLIIGFILFLGIAETSACICGQPSQESTTEEELNWYRSRAQTVILGKIVSEENLMRETGRNSIQFFTRQNIKVERFWGSPVPNEVFYGEDGYSTSCDAYFEAGESYLIFIYKIKGNKIFTGSCSGNINAKDAAEQLKLLGEGSKPKEGFLIEDNKPVGQPTDIKTVIAHACLMN